MTDADRSPVVIHQQAVETEQLVLLYSGLKVALAITALVAVFLVLVLWPVVSHQLLITWICGVAVLTAIRSISYYYFLKRNQFCPDLRYWYWSFNAGVLLASLFWCASLIWLFPLNDAKHQAFIIFTMIGMCSGGVTTLSFRRVPALLFIVPIIMTLIWRFASLSELWGNSLAVACVLFFVGLVISSRHIYQNTLQNIELRLTSKEQSLALEYSEHRLRTILDTAADAFFLHDENGQLLDVNEEACLSLGYSREELLQMSVVDMELTASQPDVELKWDELSVGSPVTISGIHRRKDNTTFPVELRIGALYEDGKKLFSVLARNITERRQAEIAKSDFISTVSHEIRTPLTSIMGSLSILKSGTVGSFSNEAGKMIRIAHENSQRLLVLINDILDMSKIESGKMAFDFKPVSINDFLSRAINANQGYAEQYHVKYTVDSSIDESVTVSGDMDRLIQVMNNLLSNATKFSPDAGVVELSACLERDNVYIGIADRGPGIPDDFTDKVFERFTQSDNSKQRKISGTGLGLNISRYIVEKHGGEIGFSPREGGGTIFFVRLPLLRP